MELRGGVRSERRNKVFGMKEKVFLKKGTRTAYKGKADDVAYRGGQHYRVMTIESKSHVRKMQE